MLPEYDFSKGVRGKYAKQHHASELKDALAKIRRGKKEYRSGKTRAIKSLSELRG